MNLVFLSKLLTGSGTIVAGAAAIFWFSGYFDEKRDREQYLADLSHQMPLAILPQIKRIAKSRTVRPIGLGVVEIPRLKLVSLIRPSSNDFDLARGVGHVEGTAKPGDHGLVALAGHRDSFFRSLREVRIGDTVRVKSPLSLRSYTVTETKIVEPADLSVLSPAEKDRIVLVTCYPFDFIGAAPQRFIVIAEPAAR